MSVVAVRKTDRDKQITKALELQEERKIQGEVMLCIQCDQCYESSCADI